VYFPTTHWSLLAQATLSGETAGREALEELLRRYSSPLQQFIRQRGYNETEAQDVTQDFLLHLLEHSTLKRADRLRGKFRSFLLTCLKNFLVNERLRANTQRRGGGREILPLKAENAETRYAMEPVDNVTAEVLFERRWARALLERTFAELQREFMRAGKSGWFDELQQFLPGGEGNLSRVELAARHGISSGAIDVAVHRLRQRFGAILREQVAQTVSSAAEVEEEIRYLMAVLSG
jgi:RNA polymerase sigma-70 factor (ECF subfamily)